MELLKNVKLTTSPNIQNEILEIAASLLVRKIKRDLRDETDTYYAILAGECKECKKSALIHTKRHVTLTAWTCTQHQRCFLASQHFLMSLLIILAISCIHELCSPLHLSLIRSLFPWHPCHFIPIYYSLMFNLFLNTASVHPLYVFSAHIKYDILSFLGCSSDFNFLILGLLPLVIYIAPKSTFLFRSNVSTLNLILFIYSY